MKMNNTLYSNIFEFKKSKCKIYPETLVEKGKRNNFRRQCINFEIKNNELHYRRKPFGLLKVIREDERDRTIEEHHIQTESQHWGINETRIAMSKKVYWRKMQVDTIKYIERCEMCIKNRKSRHWRKAPYTSRSSPSEGGGGHREVAVKNREGGEEQMEEGRGVEKNESSEEGGRVEESRALEKVENNRRSGDGERGSAGMWQG